MIPKIAHFIWLGGKPLPELYRESIDRFSRLHPAWQVKLYREIPEEMPKDLRKVCESAVLYVQKSDVLRTWLLYEYGGVYFDTDFIFVRSVDDLLNKDAWITKPTTPPISRN